MIKDLTGLPSRHDAVLQTLLPAFEYAEYLEQNAPNRLRR